jgi:hypothetical protein
MDSDHDKAISIEPQISSENKPVRISYNFK